MKKEKFHFDWVSFTTNFVAVCLGIIITFAGEGYISSKNEEKEVKKSLELIKSELEQNLEEMQMGDDFMELSAGASRFLVEYEGRYEEAPKDSMVKYANVPFCKLQLTVSHNALELMKNTGNFAKMKDLELALGIIGAYRIADGNIEMFDEYCRNKDEYLEKAMTDECNALFASDTVTAVAVWSTFASTVEGRQFVREMERMQMYHNPKPSIQYIEATIDAINEYIND